MALTRVTKNRSYFQRYQVKFRRRRQGLTDYRARRNLIVRDLDKYGYVKHRLVVRISNRDVIVQIVSAYIRGDRVLCAAYSHELPRYGIALGLTNYAAAYATGLLAARRAIATIGGAPGDFAGQLEPTGEYYSIAEDRAGPDRRPFRAILDIGLARSTTGSRVFAAMKGAADGGLHVPYSMRRLVGYKVTGRGKDEGDMDPAILRSYIFGGHVAAYMTHLQNTEEGRYKKQFARYLAAGIKPSQIEDLYRRAHQAIRDDPRRGLVAREDASQTTKRPAKRYGQPRLTLAEKRAKLEAKIGDIRQRAAAAVDVN